MSLEQELRAEQQYTTAWDRKGWSLTGKGRKFFKELTPEATISTKACPKCGDTKLVRLTSQNLKICSKCKTEIVWRLDDNQKPVY